MTSPTADPGSDLRSGLVWIALGALVVFGAWRMDRLEQQGAPIYSAPGLWPGVVGLLLALLGGALVWRAHRRSRDAAAATLKEADAGLVPPRQFALAAAMFFAYAVLLVGRGLPFWLGTSLFVTVYVLVFRRAHRADAVAASVWRDLIFALTCGVSTAVAVAYVFEQLFYVRLP